MLLRTAWLNSFYDCSLVPLCRVYSDMVPFLTITPAKDPLRINIQFITQRLIKQRLHESIFVVLVTLTLINLGIDPPSGIVEGTLTTSTTITNTTAPLQDSTSPTSGCTNANWGPGSAFFTILSLAFAYYCQPPGSLFFKSKSAKTSRLWRLSPVFILLETMEVIVQLGHGILISGVGWRATCWAILECRAKLTSAWPENPKDLTHKFPGTSSGIRVILWPLTTLQLVKILAISGMPLTSALGLAYYLAWILDEALLLTCKNPLRKSEQQSVLGLVKRWGGWNYTAQWAQWCSRRKEVFAVCVVQIGNCIQVVVMLWLLILNGSNLSIRSNHQRFIGEFPARVSPWLMILWVAPYWIATEIVTWQLYSRPRSSFTLYKALYVRATPLLLLASRPISDKQALTSYLLFLLPWVLLELSVLLWKLVAIVSLRLWLMSPISREWDWDVLADWIWCWGAEEETQAPLRIEACEGCGEGCEECEDYGMWITCAAVIAGGLVLVGYVGVGKWRYFVCEGTRKPGWVEWLG